MASNITQFRYYNNGNSKNNPSDLTADDLVNGKIFQNFSPKFQIGIQTLPGTMFYLSQGQPDPIIVGKTGIFEIDLDGDVDVTYLHFDARSINLIKNNPSAYLIIDVLYGEGGED